MQQDNEDKDNYDEILELQDKIEELESDFLKSLLEDYAMLLEKHYEYLTSREAIIETFEANEMQFTGDGKQF